MHAMHTLMAAVLSASGAAAAPLYIADPAADAIYRVDTADVGVTPLVLSASGANNVGGGPAFDRLTDIEVGGDGALYSMDYIGVSPRIMRVDTATGVRTVVFVLSDADPSLSWHDEFHVLPGGRFRFLAQLRDPAAPNRARVQRMVEVTEGPGNSAQVAILGSVVAPGNALDLFPSAQGRTLALYPQVYGHWILEGSESGIARVPETLIATSTNPVFYQVPIPFETGYSCSFPGVGAIPAGTSLLTTVEDAVQGTGSFGRIPSASITTPGGTTAVRPVNTSSSSHSVSGTTAYLGAVRFEPTAAAEAPGTWTVNFLRLGTPSLPNNVLPYSVSLWRMPFPRAHLGAALPDGTLCLAETNPPSVVRMEAATGDLASRAVLVPPGGSGITVDDLNRLTELQAADAGVLVALSEDPRVLRINTATGAMELVTTGRPGSLAPPPGGFSPRSNLRLATAPLANSAAEGSWSMY